MRASVTFADTEFRVVLGTSGRPLAMWTRDARWGVVPAGRRLRTRYAFIGPEEFRRRAGGPPRPRCG